jgi:hypothetical protein
MQTEIAIYSHILSCFVYSHTSAFIAYIRVLIPSMYNTLHTYVQTHTHTKHTYVVHGLYIKRTEVFHGTNTNRDATIYPCHMNLLPFFSRRVSRGGEPLGASAPTHPRIYHRFLFLAMMITNIRDEYFAHSHDSSCNAKINTPPSD